MGFHRKLFKQVFGVGPSNARVLIFGDRPGKEEHFHGYPFAGRTGQELDRKLWDIRVPRETLFLANLLLQEPEGKEITIDEIKRDEGALWDILDAHRFDLIVTLGALTTKYFLGPEASLEKNHAIAHETTFHYRFGLNKINTVVFPMYHLAAGFHTPDLQPFIEYDWMVLGQYLKGTYQPPAEDLFKGIEHYELVNPTSHAGLLQVLEERPSLKPGVDTEGLLGSAWGLSISVAPGSALVYRRGITPESWFKELGAWLQRRTILLHNSLHDIPILRELGIETEDFVDTMVLAFLLQVEPQGLKPLSFRHSGMEMQEYLDVVAPYAKDLYADYIFKASALEWEPDTIKIINTTRLVKKTGLRVPMKRKQTVMGTGTRLAKFAVDIIKGKTTDIKKRWDNIDEEITEKIVDRVGPFPEVGLEHVPDEEAIPYSARDADATFRLEPALAPKIDALALQKVSELDHAVIPMIERMQSVGFKIDRPFLQSLGVRLQNQMDECRDKLRIMTGIPTFNPGSGDQVAAYLFNTLGLEPVKMTKSGKRPAVDDKVMEELLIREVNNPVAVEFVNLKGDYTEAEKLKGSYVDNLDWYAGKDDVIHTNIRITRVVSGRLATFNPNLLAIPVRSQLGRLVRHGFIARPGKMLGSWDLDQIEMRVMAHVSQDPLFLAVFQDPKRHIHKETTSRIYGIPVELVNKESTEYMMAKNISFGIIYLISAKGLQAQMAQRGQNKTEEECQQMIDDWYKVYPGVRSAQEHARAEAARYGYVRTMLGRIRYLPGIHSSQPYIRSEAERAAGNHPIQGGATDIVKSWMKKVWEITKDCSFVNPLLQVHDELIMEFDEDKYDLVDYLMRESLAEAVDPMNLSVPIRCGSNVAENWGKLK